MKKLFAGLMTALNAVAAWAFGDNLTEEERMTVLEQSSDPNDPDHIVYVLAR